MVSDRTSAAPPRTLNVQKFAQSRASELEALHSIVTTRLNTDFRFQRNKRRRTTGHDTRVSRERFRKKQKVGGGGSTARVEKKLPRRVRRRIELKSNPQAGGFSASGDGTKRLRTHVWHAKRFTITKLWGFYLPLGLHGRGRGSRALLKKLKQGGALVHDASYYTAVQLEGPEDILLSMLSSVLVPFPLGNCDEASQNILSGVTYGSAMLHHVGPLYSQAVAPVTYMWRSPHSNFVSTGKCDGQTVGSCALIRQLWVWIHPAAFREGYGVLESLCERLNVAGHSVSCISRGGELAKLELIGSRAFQLIQKILFPITSISTDSCALQKCSVAGTDGKNLFKDTSILPNEDEMSTSAIVSLMVNDPRAFMGKAVVLEPTCSEVLGSVESKIQGYTLLPGVKAKNTDSLSSLFLKPEESCKFSEYVDLWDVRKGILPPVEDSFLCKEKHRRSMKSFGIGDENLGNLDASGEGLSSQFSQICPIMLLKNKFRKGFTTRWSIILPLSWVRAFWIAIVSNGAQAIGLRERHWIACEAGLPCFPSDFPDSKAYSCFMEMEDSITDEKSKLQPPAQRPLRVPTLPPWECVQGASQKRSITAGDAKLLPVTDHSMKNLNFNICDIATLGGHVAPFSGYVARTSYMLIHFLTRVGADHLLLFLNLSDGKKSLPMDIKDGNMVNQQTNGISSELKCDQKLCFLRVHLHAYKEGVFEQGAVVCAAHAPDIAAWTTRSEDGGGKCQIPQSWLDSCFVRQPSRKWELQYPEDLVGRESFRPPIGFVTTGFVQGSKKGTAIGVCEAGWLGHLREEQWKSISEEQRRKEIYVVVRNLRSTAYRLALATVVLETQEEDVEYL